MASTVERDVVPMLEVVEFLLRRPTIDEIVQFHPSRETQEYVSELLAQNREGTLSRDERADLDEMLFLESFLQLLKAKARLTQENGSNGK